LVQAILERWFSGIQANLRFVTVVDLRVSSRLHPARAPQVTTLRQTEWILRHLHARPMARARQGNADQVVSVRGEPFDCAQDRPVEP
jgi:hypothetical protein